MIYEYLKCSNDYYLFIYLFICNSWKLENYNNFLEKITQNATIMLKINAKINEKIYIYIDWLKYLRKVTNKSLALRKFNQNF